MNHLIRLKTTAPPLLMTVTLICLGLLPTAQAVIPAPDGGYPGANTAEGTNALLNLTSGIANTAVGNNALLHTTTGNWNVGIGSGTLASNTTGSFNMAIGTDALTNNTSNYNLAIGFRVGFMNTTGNHLTGIGAGALFHNTSGSSNTAVGSDALNNNTDGTRNTANGAFALFSNTTANENTAIGYGALSSNTTSNDNTAIGFDALGNNTTGGGNMAVGAAALFNNTAGSGNTALGAGAGIGVTTASNVICIGQNVVGADVSNSCFIGNIFGVSTSGKATPVLIDSNGQLGTMSSSRRFKKDIESTDSTSEAILELKPVTFHYKSDSTNTPQFGLIAEEVAKVNPALVLPDKEGKPYTVRYDQVNAMLLNEFLKEHRAFLKEQRKVEVQEKTIAELKSGMTALAVTVKEQASQIQKVSAQLEASKPVPQVVENP